MPDSQSEHWNRIAREWSLQGYSNKLLAEHKRMTHLSLIARWADLTHGVRVLKTDLFTEAFGVEQFLFDIARTNGTIVGIDISEEIVARAKKQAGQHGVDAARFLCCDVRYLPLQGDSIDLVISDSSLDHFPSEHDIVTALKELWRVLRVGGTMIVTMDNKSNVTYPSYMLIRVWMWLGLSPYFIGRTISPARLKRVLEEIGFSVEESTAIFHYPHPDKLVRWLEAFIRKLSRGKLDNAVRKCLFFSDKLENRRARYLTGRYLAMKAVKRSTPQ